MNLSEPFSTGRRPHQVRTRADASPTDPAAQLQRPWVELIFAAAMLLGSFSPGARAIQYLFTPLCGLLAYYLIRKSQRRYITFVLYLWFFSPCIRRIADYHVGFQDPSPILLAPLLASCVVLVRLAPRAGLLLSSQLLPFTLALLALVYGLLLGVVQMPIQAAITDFLRWSVPVLFGAYCLTLKDEQQEMEAACESAFLYGVLIMSVYGLWQSNAPAAWDVYWLSNLDASSFGNADKGALRVFSTMNSPGPFAAALAAGLLLLMSSPKKMARLAQVLGVAALISTEVRSAWIGALVGLLYFFVRAETKTRLRMLAFAGVSAVIMVFALTLSTSSEHLTSRFSTFTDLKQDESVAERSKGGRIAMVHALHNPLGSGMGYLDTAYDSNVVAGGTELGAHDNGIFEFLATLGVLGSVLYGGALFLLLVRGISTPHGPAPASTAYYALCLSLLVQVPTGNTLFGVDGLIFWMAAGMLLLRTTPAPAAGFEPGAAAKLISEPTVPVEIR